MRDLEELVKQKASAKNELAQSKSHHSQENVPPKKANANAIELDIKRSTRSNLGGKKLSDFQQKKRASLIPGIKTSMKRIFSKSPSKSQSQQEISESQKCISSPIPKENLQREYSGRPTAPPRSYSSQRQQHRQKQQRSISVSPPKGNLQREYSSHPSAPPRSHSSQRFPTTMVVSTNPRKTGFQQHNIVKESRDEQRMQQFEQERIMRERQQANNTKPKAWQNDALVREKLACEQVEKAEWDVIMMALGF